MHSRQRVSNHLSPEGASTPSTYSTNRTPQSHIPFTPTSNNSVGNRVCKANIWNRFCGNINIALGGCMWMWGVQCHTLVRGSPSCRWPDMVQSTP